MLMIFDDAVSIYALLIRRNPHSAKALSHVVFTSVSILRPVPLLHLVAPNKAWWRVRGDL